MRSDGSDKQFWRIPEVYDEYEESVGTCEAYCEGEECTSRSERMEACQYSERIRALLRNSRRGAAQHDCLKVRHAFARHKAGVKKLLMMKQRHDLATLSWY
eukprot:4814607-Pyramimonas_sp.AAC.1